MDALLVKLATDTKVHSPEAAVTCVHTAPSKTAPTGSTRLATSMRDPAGGAGPRVGVVTTVGVPDTVGVSVRMHVAGVGDHAVRVITATTMAAPTRLQRCLVWPAGRHSASLIFLHGSGGLSLSVRLLRSSGMPSPPAGSPRLPWQVHQPGGVHPAFQGGSPGWAWGGGRALLQNSRVPRDSIHLGPVPRHCTAHTPSPPPPTVDLPLVRTELAGKVQLEVEK